MATVIVKVPEDNIDYDFIAFTYNNKHSVKDFGIYRTSNGDRYETNITPPMKDKIAEVPGGNGQYYFGTTYDKRDIPISFAFDRKTEKQKVEMK